MNRRSTGKSPMFRHLLRLIAWGATVGPAMNAVANTESWVETNTQAVLIPAKGEPTQGPRGAAASRASAYRLNNAQGDQVAEATPLEESQSLHIVVSLKPRHAEELDRLRNQTGAQRKPLTPSEFKARYAPTDAQVQAVVAYLKENGFANIVVASNAMLISADGHASNVQTAFHAQMKRFVYQEHEVYANASAAQVPASLGQVIESVLGLQNVFVPRVARRPDMRIMRQPSAAPSSEH